MSIGMQWVTGGQKTNSASIRYSKGRQFRLGYWPIAITRGTDLLPHLPRELGLRVLWNCWKLIT